MNVLLLTVFISLVLAIIFIGMFVLQSDGGGSAERDSLLPLDDVGSPAEQEAAAVPVEKQVPAPEKP